MPSTDAHLESTEREHALAWLAGRYQWERLLHDLHVKAEATGQPVDLALPIGAEEPADEARRAA